MNLNTVALGVAIMVAVALLWNYRARIGAGFAAIGERVSTMRYGDVRRDSLNWMDWYMRTHMIPLQVKARQATQVAQRSYTRATHSVASAVAAFPGGAPTGMATVGTMIGLVIWAVVATANGTLDWSLNLAFSRNAFLATLLTALTVMIPVLLADRAQAVFRHRPIKADTDEDRADSWTAESFRSAIIGLVVAYLLLFAFMGFLGMTRADRVYETNVAQTTSAYTKRVLDINEKYSGQIRLAQLKQTQDASDGADATLLKSDSDAVESLQTDMQTELDAAASDRETTSGNLKTNQAGDATKWIAFAAGASVAEAASAFAVKDGIMLIRLALARRRERETDDKLRAVQAAEEQVGTGIIARMAHILERAGVTAEAFDGWLRSRGLLHGGGAPPPAIEDGGPVPPPTERPPVIKTVPPTPPLEHTDPTPAPVDDGADDGPTPGFSEA